MMTLSMLKKMFIKNARIKTHNPIKLIRRKKILSRLWDSDNRLKFEVLSYHFSIGDIGLETFQKLRKEIGDIEWEQDN